MQKTIVELEDINGYWWTLAGPQAGDRGVYLGVGVSGLMDAPVKVVYETPGNWPGSRYLNHRVLQRDLVFAVEIMDACGESWLQRDSAWRKAWSYTQDCKLYVTTDDGRRYLKLRLFEAPEVLTDTDPNIHGINRVGMTCVAGDPFWWEDDHVVSQVTTTDTRFDPAAFGWPLPYDRLPKETITLDVPDVNPTDQTIWLKWSVPGSEEAPAQPYVPGVPWLGAPKSRQLVWTVPDYSFTDPNKADRRVRLPGLIGGLRTDAVWRTVAAGPYKLSVQGTATAQLAETATAAQIQTELAKIVGAPNVSVQADTKVRETQIVELTGGATGGTFTLTLGGQTTAPIRYNASAFEVQFAINRLPNVGFRGCFVRADSYNCVQRVTITGDPTGTYRLTLDGKTTTDIPPRALPIQLGIALKALPNVGIFDALITGPLFGGGPYDINFTAGLAGVKVNTLQVDNSKMSGGSAVVTTQAEGGTRYAVTFDRTTTTNVPLMVGSPANLTGGQSPGVRVTTQVEGQEPMLIHFLGTLSGKDVELTGDNGVSVISHVTGGTAPAEDAFIDTDPRTEQITSASGSQLWSRMNGVRFANPIPPYTGRKQFQLTVSGAKPGQMVTLRLPRPWSRPWGMR